jgi:transcriptional regulator with XRE-family HTH domain
MSEAMRPAGVPVWDTPDRMRKAIRHAGLSVNAMAAHLDVRRETVSTWLTGRHQPSPAVLRVWALRCGVPYEWLRYGDDGPPLPRLDSNQQPFDLRLRRLARRDYGALAAA